LIYSPSYEKHLEHLKEVFDCLRTARLRMNGKKCHFAMQQLFFLGHKFTKDGCEVDKSKIQIMTKWPRPTSQTELRRFLGLCNFYRRFVDKYSFIVSPFRNLLQKDVKFVWSPQHEEAFEKLKVAMSTTPVLAFPDLSKRFYLTTDACDTAIAFLLSQKDETGRFHIVSYGGRGLRGAELNYPVQSKECLALIAGIQEYHYFLAHNEFTAITDHLSLKYLHTMKFKNVRMGRWSLFLQNYKMVIEYKCGKTLTDADAVSRRGYPPDEQLKNNYDDSLDNDANFLYQVSSQGTGDNDRVEYTFVFDDDMTEHNADTSHACDTVASILSIERDLTETRLQDVRALQMQCPDCKPLIDYLSDNILPKMNSLLEKLFLNQKFIR